MRNINCIIVDSIKPDLDRLCRYIQGTPLFKLSGVFQKLEAAVDMLRTQKVDLLFLDIENSGISGLKFLRSISYRTRVIITTKDGHFALEAFNLSVLDYLIKPLKKERFEKAVDKAYELFSLLSLREKRNDQVQEVSLAQEYLFVTSRYALVKVKLADLTYVEGLKDYLKIYLVNQPDPVITRMTMKALEEKLPQDHFFRVHKSYIVSLDKVDLIRSQRIRIGSSTVPVSDGYYETFRQKVNI
jgi:DNA-binding LytR/AlgR family response regulator